VVVEGGDQGPPVGGRSGKVIVGYKYKPKYSGTKANKVVKASYLGDEIAIWYLDENMKTADLRMPPNLP
jgi:hypothetical protein